MKVQAFRLTRDVEYTGPDWLGAAIRADNAYIDRCLIDGASTVYGCTIRTPNGRVQAKIGDYIIREPDGSLSVRKKECFKRLYRRAE